MQNEPREEFVPGIQSLKELLDIVAGKTIQKDLPGEDSGITEMLPYPFMALVGQYEMKLALLLNLINPAIGGVLLVGPRGTGKTTAVRSLLNLLPEVERSTCFYGCLPEDVEAGGLDAVCPDCAKKYAQGEKLTRSDTVRLVELPLNARLDDVIGSFQETEVSHERLRLKRGILAKADQNILYIDEVNLLDNDIIDAILDAAAYGSYYVRRGSHSANYKARFTLIGSMNPEEGPLRPQIMDRFGLRVLVSGLNTPNERIETYHRITAYRKSPLKFIEQFENETQSVRSEIQLAKKRLSGITLPDHIVEKGSKLIRELQIDSIRAEITLFEAAKAYAAASLNTAVTKEDLMAVAHLTLRWRDSKFITQFFHENQQQEIIFKEAFQKVLSED